MTTHVCATLACAFEREHRRDRRLADAAAAAADHHAALGDELVDASCLRRCRRRRGHSCSIPRVERVGEHVDLRSPDVGGEQERQLDACGSGSRSPQPVDLLVLHRVTVDAELDRVREVVRLAIRDEPAARLRVGAHLVDRGRDAGRERLEALVHDDRPERDAGAVLDRERRLDRPRSPASPRAASRA